MANCETFAELKLATNNHWSSLRIAIDVGLEFTEADGGVSADKLPSDVLILNIETSLDPVANTYRNCPNGFTSNGPGRSPTG